MSSLATREALDLLEVFLAVPEISSLAILARCAINASYSDEELVSLVERLDSLVGMMGLLLA